MSNPLDYRLDVLAASPEEMSQIAAALKEPSAELVLWVAGRAHKRPEEVAAGVKSTVSFEPVSNLSCADPSANRSRRFTNWSKDRFWGTVMTHVDLVSKQFPTAIFLLEYWDLQSSYAGKMVIRAGEEIQCVYDGNQQAQAYEWVLPNIFAPFRTEYWNGWEFGSLWNKWVRELTAAVQGLQTTTSASDAGVTPAAETVEVSSGPRVAMSALPCNEPMGATEVPDHGKPE